MINPSGEFIQPQPISTESCLERFSIHRLNVADSLDPRVNQILFSNLPDAGDAPNGQIRQEVMNLVRLNDKQPVRLLPIRSDLRQKLVWRNAGRGGQI